MLHWALLVCYQSMVESSLLTVIITETLKGLFRRPRPMKYAVAPRHLPIRDDVSNPAFPSGDSAQVRIVTNTNLGCSNCRLLLSLLW